MAKTKKVDATQMTIPGLTTTVGPPMTIRGVTGLKRSTRTVYDEWHPQLRGTKAIKIYREMRDNDAVCGSIYYAMDTLIRQTPITMPPADDSPLAELIADHVETCLDDMDTTFDEWLGDVNSQIWAGYSLHGTRYKVRRGRKAPFDCLRSRFDDGRLGWAEMPIRAQDSITEWDFRDDGKVLAAFQQAPPRYKRTRLDFSSDHMLLFRTLSNKNSPEGRSLFRNAYRSWYFLKRIQELEAIGVERDMAGMLVFTLPVEYFNVGATDSQKATVALYQKIAERMRRCEQDGLTMPAVEEGEGKTGFDARLLQSGGKRPMDVDGIVKRYESRIALSVLGESVLLGMQGNVGSWSLASSKTHMFAVALKAIMRSIEGVMTTHAIPRLVEANGWPAELSPRCVFGDIESDDSTELSQAISTLVTSGVMRAGPQLEEYLRRRMGLPLEDDLSQAQVDDAAGQMAENEAAQTPGAVQLSAEIAAEKTIPTAVDQTISQTVTADQAAQILGISRGSVNRAVSRGDLPGRRIGGVYRIYRQHLEEAMRGKLAA